MRDVNIGMLFTWTVILGIISALFETNHQDATAIVFATLSGVGLLLTFWAILEST